MLADGLREMLDLDAPLVRSLRMMLLRPGRLTAAYLSGRRISLVSPLRLYLAASVVFAAALVFADQTVQLTLEGSTAPDRAQWLRAWSWTVLVMMPAFAGLSAIAAPAPRAFAEHLVFAMYFHAFGYTVTAAGLAVVEASRGTVVSTIALLAIPVLVLVQFQRALRDAYAMTRRRATVSAAGLAVAYALLQMVALVGAGVALGRMTG